jgi:ribosomal protein S18 acetylase RimI-like enzyme
MAILIETIDEGHDQFADDINRQIDSEAELKRNLSPLHYYAFQAVERGTRLGGIFGFDNFGALHVEGIWVSPASRLKGIGKLLMDAAEKLARERMCKCITLFTMDFQAVEFYRRLGYVEELRRTYYHKNSQAIYFLKVL